MKKWLDKYDTNGSLSKYPWGGPMFDAKKIQEALDQYNKMKIGYPYPLDAYQKKEVTDQDVTNYEAYMSGDKANKNYFYETHELVKNSDGTQSWKVKDNVNYNEAIKGTPLGQFIYKQPIIDKNNNNNQIPTDQFGNIYTDYAGLEMGYSPYNLWTSPTSGISLYGNDPGNILNQIEMVPEAYPTIYFLGANNPIKEGEMSLWNYNEVVPGPYRLNESILGSSLADQGYSTLNLMDTFEGLDKLKGKFKETFGYGDNLLRVVDPTDYNVMGALQLTPEIVEYLKNQESELPDYKFESAATPKERALYATNQDELLKAVEGERIIKEYLLKQAGIDPALGMQYLMHYNYTPLDVYSEINNPSTLNWYNQIGAVKNKFQDISHDKYTNDPEYNRLLNQFLDENKVVRKKGGSAKYPWGGPIFDAKALNEGVQKARYQENLKFHEDWMKSPKYKEMLYKPADFAHLDVQSPETLSQIEQIRKNNLKEISNTPLNISYNYDPDEAAGWYGLNTKRVTVAPKGFSRPTLMTHEISHAVDYLNPGPTNGRYDISTMPSKDIALLNRFKPSRDINNSPRTTRLNNIDPDWKSKLSPEDLKKEEELDQFLTEEYDYFTDPSEVRSRLGEIRKASKDAGYYDPFTEDAPNTIINSFNGRHEGLNELRNYYTDDQIIEMLNRISYNKSNTNNTGIYQSKLGGSTKWLDRYDVGGTSDCDPGYVKNWAGQCVPILKTNADKITQYSLTEDVKQYEVNKEKQKEKINQEKIKREAELAYYNDMLRYPQALARENLAKDNVEYEKILNQTSNPGTIQKATEEQAEALRKADDSSQWNPFDYVRYGFNMVTNPLGAMSHKNRTGSLPLDWKDRDAFDPSVSGVSQFILQSVPLAATLGAGALTTTGSRAISLAGDYLSALKSALAADATIGGLTLPGVNLGNAIGLTGGLHSANMLGSDIDTGYYGSDAPLVDKITRGLETGLGIVGSPGVLEGMGAGYKGLQVFTPALKNFATNLGDYLKYGHNYKNIRNYVNEGFPAANTTPKITTFRNPKTGRTEVYQYDLADRVIPRRTLPDVKRKFKNLRKDIGMPYADYLLGKYIPGASHPISLAKDAGIVIDPTTGHLFDSNTRAWMNLTFGKENPILEHPVDVLGRSFGKKLFDVNPDGSLVYPNTPKKLGGSVLQKQKKGGQKNAAVEYYDYIRYK